MNAPLGPFAAFLVGFLVGGGFGIADRIRHRRDQIDHAGPDPEIHSDPHLAAGWPHRREGDC